MSWTSRYGILCLSLTLMLSCQNNSNKEASSLNISFKKEGTLQIFKGETDSIIKHLDIEFAQTEYETQTGLMFRDSLSKNQGMLFIFKDEQLRSFFMKNTRIPLDIIYISSDGKIASIVERAKPFDETSLPSGIPAKYVLEVYGGTAETLNIDIGDRIEFQTKEE